MEQGHKAKDFKAFMDKYPDSKFYDRAKSKYERQLFIEETKRDDLASYISFLKRYPDSPFRVDAEDRIYELETSSKTVSSFEVFINNYQENRNISRAWNELYDAHLAEHPFDDAISSFIERYPNTPYKKEVERELQLAKTHFFPVREDSLWGFTTVENIFTIPASFHYVDEFSEGLAPVTVNNKVGYISKTGELKIPYQFDDGFGFHEGYAVVEYDGAYGMINRQGEFIISPDYEDLGEMSNNLILFQKDNLYGFFNKRGKIAIRARFTDAFNF